MHRLPPWYRAGFVIGIAIMLLFNLGYLLGADSFGVGPTDEADIDRSGDVQLYHVTDHLGFSVPIDGGDQILLGNLERELPVFRVCGQYTLNGTVIGGAHFLKGDWVYRKNVQFDGVDAINLVTGETVELDTAEPFYTKHGLTFDAENQLTAARVSDRFEAVSTANESCIVLNLSLMVLLVLWALLGLVLMVVGRGRRLS